LQRRTQPWQRIREFALRPARSLAFGDDLLGGRHPNLHFHDLRGTAATRFYIAGLKVRTIGEILGWAENDVEKIIRNQAAQ
jgi:integrase